MPMRKIVLILCALVATSCGYDRFGELSETDFVGTEALPNADLALLYEHYYGEPVEIVEGIVFDGYVTSSDRSGNFFRSFVIEDVTAAVEIRAGFYDIYNTYQLGRRVVLRAKGLAVGKYNGIIQIGACINKYSAYRVEEFGSRVVLDTYLERDVRFAEENPAVREIGVLDENDCGRLVQIGRLLADAPAEATWAQPEGEDVVATTGTAIFRNCDGKELLVVTSGYADFAGEKLPADSVTLTGILMYGKFGALNNKFALKLRSLEDVAE